MSTVNNTPKQTVVANEEPLAIGRSLSFPSLNTYTRATAQTKTWRFFAWSVLGWVVSSAVLALFTSIDSSSGLTFGQSFFAASVVISPLLIWSFLVFVMSRVRYTNTIEKFVLANNQALRLSRRSPDGAIGRLIDMHADTRGDADRLTTRLSVRNNQDNTACGVETTHQGDHGVFVGRCYTTGPYMGFAHMSIKMPASTREMPQFIIDATANNHNFTATNLVRSLGTDQQYSLEGNFPDYFKVYASDQNVARLAYYILTPDLMQILLEHVPSFDIEFYNNRLNIYWYDPALKSELEPDWANFLPKAFWLLEFAIKPLTRRIELYKTEPSVSGKLLRVDNNLLMEASRDILYGRRQDLATSAAKISRRAAMATIVVMVVLAILFVLGVVIAFSIGML